MSHLKTAGGPIGGRLIKSVATSALAISTLAGGLVLSGGEANATAICFTFNPVTPTPTPPCVDGDWTNTYIGFNYTVDDPGLDGDVRLEDITPSNPDAANVRINFLNTTPDGSSGSYEYSIKTADHNIIKVGFDADQGTVTGHVYDIYKYVFSDAGFTNLLGELHLDETSVDAFLDTNNSELWIRDRWDIQTAGLIQITNSYQAPGPLPILGAGAAFGFSRKLRSRIKSAHSA